MPEVTSFSVSAIGQKNAAEILADYLALERTRAFRRLLVMRCAMLALGAAITGWLVPGFSLFARLFMVLLCLLPAAGAWIAEIWLGSQLSRRLDGIRTTDASATAQATPRRKVIKSS